LNNNKAQQGMNYKIQVSQELGTQRRDTVWCIIGGELWHESEYPANK